MYIRSTRFTWLPAFMLGMLILGAGQPASAQKHYQTVSTFQKFGFSAFNVNAINSNGAILADNTLYHGGVSELLPDIPDSGFTMYTGLNASLSTTGFAFNLDFSGALTFVRRADGSVTFVDIPAELFPSPTAINARGDVVGSYFDSSFNTHGFIADVHGVRTLDIPGAAATVPNGINASGVIVGTYYDANFNGHPFVLDRKGLHDLVIPGAAFVSVSCINDHGQIGGTYSDGVSQRGFVYDRGQVTLVDYTIPNAPDSIDIDFGPPFGVITFYKVGEGASLNGLNDRGEVVGAADAFYLASDPTFPFGLLFFDSFWGAPVP